MDHGQISMALYHFICIINVFFSHHATKVDPVSRPLQCKTIADFEKSASQDTSLLCYEAKNEESIVPELVLLGLEVVCELFKIGQAHIAASAKD